MVVFFPRLHLDWSTLDIRSNVTNEVLTLPQNISITRKQRNSLTSILNRPYWCVMVTKYKGQFAILDLPARDWDEAPAYERGSRGHVNRAMSLVTLTPSVPGIYPQLSSVSEDVKD